jgi:hypothetical protein
MADNILKIGAGLLCGTLAAFVLIASMGIAWDSVNRWKEGRIRDGELDLVSSESAQAVYGIDGYCRVSGSYGDVLCHMQVPDVCIEAFKGL